MGQSRVAPSHRIRFISCCRRRAAACFCGVLAWVMGFSAYAAGQANPQPATSSAPAANSQAELASHDEPTTFHVSSKLVVVRAVVRDSFGHAVGNLHKEDFVVSDKGKPQVITQFEVEQPGDIAAKARRTSQPDSGADVARASASGVSAASLPERFVAYLFDDVHLTVGDLVRVREAADRHFATLKPGDRAAIVTTSGQTSLDFTDDRTKLHQTLLQLRPRPINSGIFSNQCPEISFYQADLIVNKNDQDARGVAVLEAEMCGPQSVGGVGQAPTALGNPEAVVNSLANAALAAGEHESRTSLRLLGSTLQILSRMPGQREVVLVSPGFLTPDMETDYYQVVDQALRSQVTISTLDARGLYVDIPFGDASHQSTPSAEEAVAFGAAPPAITKTQIEMAASRAQDDVLEALADETGGDFFHNNNDFDEGLRRLDQPPEYSYVLAFVPQSLKLDGGFHALSVKLVANHGYSLQARRGYYAPKTFADPEEEAKQEIEDEMYSQEELHQLPVELHTQFFKSSEDSAKLSVLAHVDVEHLHFHKGDGRNSDVLTCVSALFNRNGNFIEGTQKVVTMHWKDETLERKLRSGLTLKTDFDVKPGTYLVRLVVRDSEGKLMSAENGSVEIQ